MFDLTIERGIEIQNEHLAQWKDKLIPEAYNDLELFAKEKNNLAKDGYQIRRGNDLTVFVCNWKPKNKTS